MKDSKLKQKRFYDSRYSSIRRASHKLHSLPFLFYDTQLVELMLKISQRKEAPIILDVGTGQGTDVVLLSKKASQVVGIDISNEAIRTAKIIAENEDNSGHAHFVVADAENLPFKEEVFDVVCCKDALHHVSDPRQTLSEMKRVTKVKGYVAAIEANALNPQMIIIGMIYFSVDKGVLQNTRTRLQTLFLEAGLSNVSVIETEFLPRHLLFEYRSPINKLLGLSNYVILEMLKKIERNWQKHPFLSEFSNYLLVTGFKNVQPTSCKPPARDFLNWHKNNP